MNGVSSVTSVTAGQADGAPVIPAGADAGGLVGAPAVGGDESARGVWSIAIGCTRSFSPVTATTLLETVEATVAGPVAARPTLPSASRYRSRPVWKVPSRAEALPVAVTSSRLADTPWIRRPP